MLQKCLFVRADGIKIIFWDEKREADDAKNFLAIVCPFVVETREDDLNVMQKTR